MVTVLMLVVPLMVSLMVQRFPPPPLVTVLVFFPVLILATGLVLAFTQPGKVPLGGGLIV